MKCLMGLLVMVSAVAAVDYFLLPSPYRYTCSEEKCYREIYTTHVKRQQDIQQYTTLAECNLVCGKYGSLWPRPKEVVLARETINFLPQNIRFTKVKVESPELKEMLHEQAHYFMRNLHFLHPDYKKENKGPFTEYQQEIYYNSTRNLNQYGVQRNQFQSKPVARFDLFELGSRFSKQFRSQNQDFQSLFNNKDGRDALDQMRYETVSPFNNQQSNPLAGKQTFEIHIEVDDSETELSMDTDESYSLGLETKEYTITASINADSYYGARHAMESLSQLIAYNEHTNSLQVVKTVSISDEPAFKYRGIMLDTGRNFYQKEMIMSLLDTMATNKLNTFHWHISDAASFPMYLLRHPQMSYYGAYSPNKVYYPQDIHEIVEYANQRGIRVIPELDTPSHAGAGWSFKDEEGKPKLVLCNNPEEIQFYQCNEVPCGQLNPTNPEVYDVLKNVYSDMLEAFNPEFFHMGGNDMSFECWAKSPEITDALSNQNVKVTGPELSKVWERFQTKALTKLRESNQEIRQAKELRPMMFSSSLVTNLVSQVDTLQITDDANSSKIKDYISKGFKIVFSNADVWNFEGPAPSWASKAQTYKKDAPQPSWEQVYENSPLDMFTNLGISNTRPDRDSEIGSQVLGGEGMIWSYQTDAESLQSTLWPRGAALAERLWTDPLQDQFQATKVEYRMASQRERMVNRGIHAQPFQPEYCFHNQNACTLVEYNEKL